MFGFPVNLQNNGVEKLTNDADNGFPKIQQREIFYSVRDGSYTDEGIWQTTSGRVGLLPTINDDVYIRHDVGIFGVQNTYRVNSLNISNRLSIRPNIGNVITIEVYGNLNANGILDIASVSSNAYLRLYGDNNFVQTIVQNSSSLIDYAKNGNQSLMDITYQNLYLSGAGIKTPKNNLVVLNELKMQGTSQSLELLYFDLSVFGSSAFNSGNLLTKSHFGNVLFAGSVNIGTLTPKIDFSQGNPNVECRGGIFTGVSNGGDEIKTGTGTWRFTTNNQSISSWNYPLNWDAPILIDNITLTIQGQAGADGGLNINAPINGTTGSSQLLMGATGVLYFNSFSSVSSMTTGIWNFTTNNNKIGYTGNYTATIPSYFTTFHNLIIAGTGTKSLGVNTTLNGNLDYGTTAFLECGIYDLTINGTFINIFGSTKTFSKTGSGNLNFFGNVNFNNANFKLSGNPNVEFRNGVNLLILSSQFVSGTGQWKFSTNNQSISFGAVNLSIDSNILISGAINLTHSTNSIFTLNGTLNGDNALSKYVAGVNSILYLNNSTPLMATGQVDFTTNANTLGYTFNGNYTIPYTTLQSLYYGGTGIKTLSGNTILLGGLQSSGGGELDLTTYNITINGNTALGGLSKLSKTGAGNILFIGNVNFNNSTLNFIGNPNVEFRNGATLLIYEIQTISGTGNWNFTTNNQILSTGGISMTFNCNIIMANDIVLSVTNSAVPIFTGIFNGSNVNSKLLITTSSSLNYQNATQPMATGILDTFTNANTWIYGNANQDIKGGPTTGAKQVYRNLTLNGGGTKTLQGFVSVLNTYTLTSPATLANNGFTLTNP